MNAERCSILAALGLALTGLPGAVHAQTLESAFRTNGTTTLAAFEPVRQELQNCSAVIQRERTKEIEGRKILVYDDVVYGVVMSAEGMILTKASEVTDEAGLVVRVGSKLFKNPVILGTDPIWDVALIKVDATGLSPAKLATDLPDPERGTWVVANGSSSKVRTRPQVGIISANAREIFPAGGVVLGIVFKPKDEKLVVEEVREGSGAQAAGIKKGDLLAAVAGEDVTDQEALSKLFQNRRAGEEVEVTVDRDGQKVTLQVRLTARTDLFPDTEEDMSRNDQMSGDFSKRRSNFPRVIQHDIIANASTIGGPVLDLDGRCLGMNIARADRCETFAIPAGDLKSLADRLMTAAGGK